MVKEAQAHEAEDKKKKDAIDTKNQADAFVYQAEKTIKDLGDKADRAQVAKVQEGINKVKDALKSNDTEAIKKAMEEAQKPLYDMSSAAYQQAGAQQQAQQQQNAGGQQQSQDAGSKKDDDTIDAEYTEVHDDDKK